MDSKLFASQNYIFHLYEPRFDFWTQAFSFPNKSSVTFLLVPATA